MDCKLHGNATECSLRQSEMFLCYLKYVSKSFYGEYSIGNRAVQDLQEVRAKREALRDSAL